jgi:hypothetical protein
MPKTGEQNAAAGVTKLITVQMRQQQIRKATRRLEEYANCLGQFFRDVTQLKSFQAALRVTEDVLSGEPLETLQAREERPNEDEDDDLSEFEADLQAL